MTVTVSLVLVLGIALAAAIKTRSIAVGGALLAALFGFYLASTTAAPDIQRTVTHLTDTLSSIGN
ncbi:hypothetical protein RKE29_05800 [Streptomyces sp. B1866]|uniref:hypothetical protein n=1 Tax=Streptomyces sp. B1866 TaxID=3075431 RepID=UPI0028905BAC|nr:hypothetical protein [Streptomyces sp. B1866]MDT3396158.1 hypothetical protein [Streptomyces sp. B1866]